MLYAFLLLILMGSCYAQPNAFCSKPVTDLVGIAMHETKHKKLPIQNYTDLPFSGSVADQACTRLTQLLFNEQVEILQTQGDEAKVKIFHWYHNAGNPPKKQTVYWAPKASFTKLTKQTKKNVPPSISFDTKTVNYKNVITLTDYFHDKKRGITYSAGTRFTKTPQQKKINNYSVYAFCPHKQTTITIHIPKNKCIESVPKNKRQFFVNTLRTWTNKHRGLTPYVLGGASIGAPRKHDRAFTKRVKKDSKTIALSYRHKPKNEPAYGIDCAHTISRAAQISGIPYFVKNTSTIRTTYQHLTKKQTIEDGDILVWKGHTAVVSDTQKGLLIEARGYDHGYGKLQEIPFSKQFKGIKTTEQLKTAYLHKTPLTRLDKAGSKVQTISDLAIIKLPA